MTRMHGEFYSSLVGLFYESQPELESATTWRPLSRRGPSLVDVRPLSSVPLRKKMNADDMLAAAVTAKVEDGNIKAAIRILCSEEKPATDVKASYEKLLE